MATEMPNYISIITAKKKDIIGQTMLQFLSPPLRASEMIRTLMLARTAVHDILGDFSFFSKIIGWHVLKGQS